MNSSFKSVLSAITSLTPPPSSESPYSLSALIDSPASGEKHSRFYTVNSCEYDTDSPSCYDSDSLLDFTTSSYLDSIDTLDTSVSWYCRGDEDDGSQYGDEDEDSEMHISLRSGERTPLSPNALDSPAPLMDSKVFILRPVRLLNDDFDFTCAGPEEASSLGVRVRYQLQHPRHHYHHHHHHARRHNNKNHAHKPHPSKPERTFPSDSVSKVSKVAPLQFNLPKLQSSTIDYSKRRWSAPSTTSPHSSMLTRATTMMTGTTLLDTPLSLSQAADYSESSSISQETSTSDFSKANSSPPRESLITRGKAALQMYTITDAQNQILMSKLKALEISSSSRRVQKTVSSSSSSSSSSINGMDTPTPKTWPHRRNSEAFYHHSRSRLLDVADTIGLKDAVLFDNRHGKQQQQQRSQTMHLFCASNKWGNQPPNGYI